jgi:hypothetical protein
MQTMASMNYIFYKPVRSLRSQSAALIEMSKNARTKIYGERRFDVAAGTLSNSLPASLRNEQSKADIFVKPGIIANVHIITMNIVYILIRNKINL